jgi:GDP-4-dehydro-6-deoxy-D-mannose reductase
MARWMVTGASGFVGRHVAAHLADRLGEGDELIGLGRARRGDSPVKTWIEADLDNAEALRGALSRSPPSMVIHCAGMTPPADPAELYRANTRRTWRLLRSLRALGRPVRVVIVGSAAELGPMPAERLPTSENEDCRPADAYGLSKWAESCLGLAMNGGRLEVVAARVFNPIGSGLPVSNAFGRYAHLLLHAAPGPVEIGVGPLDARRDFVDVRDVAGALYSLAIHGHAGERYHVGTGMSRSIEEGLAELIRLSGREVFLARADCWVRGAADSRADVTRIKRDTGWSAQIAFEQSLEDLWHFERTSLEEREARVARSWAWAPRGAGGSG